MSAALRKIGLWPLSLLYGFIIQTRNALFNWGIFKQHRVKVQIISVGNLTAGGTGKTPMAEFLLRTLAHQGKRVAYLSRGYGRTTTGYLRVNYDEHTALEVGDEALQVASKFPQLAVAVCEDRVLGVESLLKEQALDVVVLDDAFQHRKIQRDLNIVMIDANRPPWEEALLPLGMLREPISSLKRADLIVVNKLPNKAAITPIKARLNHPAAYAQLKPLRLVPFAGGPSLSLDELDGRHCLCFSGLGNNKAFRNTLCASGVRCIRTYEFPDHHRFDSEEIKRITRRYRSVNKPNIFSEPLLIITTEKDYFRLKNEPWFKLQFAQFPFYYLEVGLDLIAGNENFAQALAPFAGTPIAQDHARQIAL